MPASKVRADYEALASISQVFGQQADCVRGTFKQLKEGVEALQGGDWVGKGADKFYQEMNSAMLPAVQRLAQALERASETTKQISEVMKQAEEDAARLFRCDDLDNMIVGIMDGAQLNPRGATPANGSGGTGGSDASGKAGAGGAPDNGSGGSGGPAKAAESTTPQTLTAAKDLESELRKAHPDFGKGFNGYGDGKDQYVCTTFVAEVLKRSGYEMAGGVQNKVNINLDWKSLTGVKDPSQSDKQQALKNLVAADDPRIRGVVTALVDSHQGTAISDVRQLQQGDFVQYWYIDKNGNMAGHVVQVEKVVGPGKILAHGSHSGTKGVATISLNLNQFKHVYSVRPKPIGD